MSERLFSLFLPGATWRDRLIACFASFVGLALVGLAGLAISRVDGLELASLPLLVAPLGASSVLLFIVPSSPMAQPWPLVGGNLLSCLVGVAVAKLVPEPLLAAPLALGLAIFVMSLCRCLHPPGGAAALTAVLGGPAVSAAGFGFAIFPMGLESLLLMLLGLAFHRASGRSYPHRPAPATPRHGTVDPPAALRAGFQAADIDAALADMHEAFDIDREDLDHLLRQVEQRALLRTQGQLTAADIMSRDLVRVAPDTSPEAARALLLRHRIRTLPVIDAAGRLLGAVGLRELIQPGATVGDLVAPAVTVAPSQSAVSLVAALTDGRSHAVVVVDNGAVVGLVTQTDLLAALARVLAVKT